MRWIPTLVITLVLGVYLRASSGGDTVSWHVAGDRGWTIVFPVGKAELVYRDIRWAIEIKRVQCDGVDVQPTEQGRQADADWGVVNTAGAEWIYSWPAAHLNTAVGQIEDCGMLRLVCYSIPVDARRVSIWYVVRFPGGRRSDLMRVRSFDINSWPMAGNPNTSVLVPDERVGDLPDTSLKEAPVPLVREYPEVLKTAGRGK